jgi:hypothetical protein
MTGVILFLSHPEHASFSIPAQFIPKPEGRWVLISERIFEVFHTKMPEFQK